MANTHRPLHNNGAGARQRPTKLAPRLPALLLLLLALQLVLAPAALAALGGPRCCKRNSFTAIRAAAEFTREHLGVAMDLPDRVLCRYFPENQQCIRRACPYYPGGGEGA